jgi:GT2 family glycosyltransferase
MTDAPDVTVVIPTHNRCALLAEALASLQRQKELRWQAVVVDDASTDDTWAWLQRLRDPRITALRQEACQRQALARNLGLEAARGRYCLFLDDDDLLWPAALRSLADALDRSPRAVAAIGARQDWFTAQGFRRRDVHPLVTRLVNINRPLLAGWSAVPSQTLFRTAIVREAGGYDNSVVPCEDRDLLHRVARRGPCVLISGTVTTYRIPPQQWRPANIRQIRERVARRAIRALPPAQWRAGLRIRRMVLQIDAAEVHCTTGSPLRAIPLIAKAMLEAPATLLSPLIGPWVLRRLAGRLARRVFPAPH